MAGPEAAPDVDVVDIARRYALGPFVLAGQRWPRSWVDYLDSTLARDEGADRPELHVALGSLGPSWSQTNVTVGEVRVEHAAGAMQVFIDGVLEARWSMDQAPIVIDIDDDFFLTHVTLGNVLRAAVATWLPLHGDGLMLHASSAVLDGQGALFAGVSTAGKTTLALGLERGRFLSDDISLIEGLSGRPHLMASPFFGSAGRRGHDLDGPLRAIGLLAKSTDGATHYDRLVGVEAVQELLRHVVAFGHDKALHEATFSRLLDLLEHVPVFRVTRSLDTPADDVMAGLLKAAGA